MVLDIPEERGLSNADIHWGDTTECRFPLFNFLQPLELQWMCMLYLTMWLGKTSIHPAIYHMNICMTPFHNLTNNNVLMCIRYETFLMFIINNVNIKGKPGNVK